MMNADMLGLGLLLKKLLVHRNVRVADLRDAKICEQVFLGKSAETFPGTTDIGASAAVLRAPESKGQAQLTRARAYRGVELTADRSARPNQMDYLQPGTVKRTGSGAVPVRVLVNDEPVNSPAIDAEGEFVGDKAQFYFLDDERNPLVSAFRVGIGAVNPLDPSELSFCKTLRKNGADPMLLATRRCDRPGAAIAMRCASSRSPTIVRAARRLRRAAAERRAARPGPERHPPRAAETVQVRWSRHSPRPASSTSTTTTSLSAATSFARSPNRRLGRSRRSVHAIPTGSCG
jgi:hypothetical protein